MADLRAQVILPGLSNKPEDVFVNTFHFSSQTADGAAFDVIKAHLAELYNVGGLGPSGNATPGLAHYMSRTIKRDADAVLIKIFNLADPEPRMPVERRFTLAAAAGDGTTLELPAEVALCGSFYALQNRPRLRGRVYFGPFHALALQDATNERGRPAQLLVESAVVALKRLITKPANTQNLAVRGKADGEPIGDTVLPQRVLRVATAGWVDDAFDTQRRRGQDAMTRTTF